MESERKMGDRTDLVCESICNRGNVQAFDAVVANALELARLLNDTPREFISHAWLKKSRAFIYTTHELIRRDLSIEVGPLTWEWIWKCTVCNNERVYGKELKHRPSLASAITLRERIFGV